MTFSLFLFFFKINAHWFIKMVSTVACLAKHIDHIHTHKLIFSLVNFVMSEFFVGDGDRFNSRQRVCEPPCMQYVDLQLFVCIVMNTACQTRLAED
jgi:hypothetical protein